MACIPHPLLNLGDPTLCIHNRSCRLTHKDSRCLSNIAKYPSIHRGRYLSSRSHSMRQIARLISHIHSLETTTLLSTSRCPTPFLKRQHRKLLSLSRHNQPLISLIRLKPPSFHTPCPQGSRRRLRMVKCSTQTNSLTRRQLCMSIKLSIPSFSTPPNKPTTSMPPLIISYTSIHQASNVKIIRGHSTTSGTTYRCPQS